MPTYLDRVAAAGARVSFEASPSPAAPPVMPGPRTMGQETDLNHPLPIFQGEDGGGLGAAPTAPETPNPARTVTARTAPLGTSKNAEQNNMAALPLKESTTQDRESHSASAPLPPSLVRNSPPIPVPPRLQRQTSPTASVSNAALSGSPSATPAEGRQSDIGNSSIKGKTQREGPRNFPLTHSNFVAESSTREVVTSLPVQPQIFPGAVHMQARDNERSMDHSRESLQMNPEVPRATNQPSAVPANRTPTPVTVAANQFSPVLPRVGRTSEPEPRIRIDRVDVLVTNQLPSPPPARAVRHQGGNWQEGLRARFLDRFTLRP